MSALQQQSRGARCAPRDKADTPATADATIKRPFLSPAEMEELMPIKLQHAAARFVIEYLARLNNGYYGEETQVGSDDDLRGIDFHLKHRTLPVDIPVDFSMGSKGGFAVKLQLDWFEAQADGSYVFRTCCAQALFRAFLPAMDPNNKWNLLGWKLAQRP
ncbi:MAG: hypothetical protein JST01_03440 [Cyanobacteria bacterium SZAS TMP-1]|nr:hypothetical protein [Cyanobacteria bacterium SZAS TMP-1]